MDPQQHNQRNRPSNPLDDSILKRDASSDDQQQLIKQAQSFINTLPSNSHLDGRTLIPTTTSTTPGQLIDITGTTAQPTKTNSGSNSDTNTGNTSSTSQTEAFVIDLTKMPSAAPTQLKLHSIGLNVIIGPAVSCHRRWQRQQRRARR
jgi:hypothetical protein